MQMLPAFVISPIGKPSSPQRLDADKVLDLFIRPAARACGFEPYRGDSVSSPGMIVSQICESIIRDPLIFAYLRAGNPNVYYELAIAHTLRKPVVLLKAQDETIPFDLNGARVITVDSDESTSCVDQIKNQIIQLTADDAHHTQPISISPEAVLSATMPRVASQQLPEYDVSGRWTGFTIEIFPPGSDGPYKNYHAEMRLSAIGHYITGSVYIAYGDDFDQPTQNTGLLLLHGLLRSPRFARLNYDNDRLRDHCGILFLEFNETGTEASGTFAGCGIASKQPVHGKVTMRKA